MSRFVEDILEDIAKIKEKMLNSNAEEKIDDMTIKSRSISELKLILDILEEELSEADPDTQITEIERWGRGRRVGFQR
ncbi:MAG: hypothetical protein ACRC6E_08265 [Fusobacteriaceae bacterium]